MSDPITHFRRNHGLEHAVVHLLTQRQRPVSGGMSFTPGFFIFGPLEVEEVMDAVMACLERLRSGQEGLALHPYCGTNFATAGVFAGVLAGLAGMIGQRKRMSRMDTLSLAVMLAMPGVIFGIQLGNLLQHFTTSGRPGNLHVLEVRQICLGSFVAHFVRTQD